MRACALTCDEVSLGVVAPDEGVVDARDVVREAELRQGAPLRREVGHQVVPVEQPVLLICKHRGGGGVSVNCWFIERSGAMHAALRR